MTKNQELAILNEAIAKLGPDSYLGPWLTEVRAEVEAAIRSDVFPTVSLRESCATARATIEQAQEDAKRLRAAAEKLKEQAGREMATARAAAGRINEKIERATAILRA